MKKIELDAREIKLIISALDLNISHNLEKVYGNVPYTFREKKEVASMEVLVDKFLSKLEEVECTDESKEALTVDWNMGEFKQVLREVVKDVNDEILTVDWNVEEFKETLREVVREVVI
ncbi:hypothetical protein QJK47_18005 [Clostridioides difficile]|nr:hypothetical protein [Clostridioides difficile]